MNIVRSIVKCHFSFFLSIKAIIAVNMCQAQNCILPLWGDGVPNQRVSLEKEEAIRTDILRIGNVQNPTLACYLPSNSVNTHKAVIICPGGGYSILAYEKEGTSVAEWFQKRGIAAFVLKYRLPTSNSLIVPHKAPLQDAQKAIRLVRQNAAQWGISTTDIGVLGFSAGGHLASTLGVHYDEETYLPSAPEDSLSARPDFMALLYPVINMNAAYAHKGSVNNLLGKDPKQGLLDYYSNELHIDSSTPPTFLAHAQDDKGVPIENSQVFYKQLKKAGVPAEIQIYETGGHGFGMSLEDQHLRTWISLLYDWILNMDNKIETK
ncbi:alpha/beta hydrolase [Aestuariivivens insulae]|uniref:alpha/beta hydrolase n=1 Tax=Aestuariivivens insulae TaxID=1621988 RepID=UPI001F58FA63|nr:alpha/beta hydrolase [Aestuariivivens insulae]